jgi:hypothetical protein
MRKSFGLLPVLLVALVTACGDGGGDDEGHATMAPGEDCMRSGCHGNFTVEGTVFPRATSSASAGLTNASVVVTDANSAQTTLTSNAAGNFYTSKTMVLPLQAAYVLRNGTRTDMSGTPAGACTSCHSLGSNLGAVYAN